jgi:transposase InsO family protein
VDSTSLTPTGVFVEGSTMPQKVIAMEAKLAAVFAHGLTAGRRPNVSAVCAELGISRQSYYKYRRRFAADGLAGLQERSRRPQSSPARTAAAVEEAIVRARKELAEEGWDNGAVSIYYRLLAERAGLAENDPRSAVPSARTVHRVLVRQGLVVPDPAKRPRSSLRRFEFPATDDCWQIDATEIVLRPATSSTAPVKAVVFQVLDDHSRYEVASLAWPIEDGAGSWTVMTTAIARYGLPGLVLSDNSAAFSGKLRRSGVVAFETNLRALGIRPITSRPYHPQTCGKNERIHRTYKQWMRRRGLHPTTIEELQAALDTWREAYNNRPHQALAGATPTQRRATGMRTSPRPAPAAAATTVTHSTVSNHGNLYTAGTTVYLGAIWAGRTITCIRTGTELVCLDGDQLVRQLTVEAGTTYIGNGKSTGGRRQPRINDTLPTTN